MREKRLGIVFFSHLCQNGCILYLCINVCILLLSEDRLRRRLGEREEVVYYESIKREDCNLFIMNQYSES
jgi:hypothetical protein